MKSISNSTKTKITVDIFMSVFLILSFVRWDDENFIFHLVVGCAFTLFYTAHVLIHRKWLNAVTKSAFSGKINKSLKGKFIVDILLIIVWDIAIITGFLAIANRAVFGSIHGLSSRVGLVLVLIHAYQHRGQIKSYHKGKF